MAELCRMLYKRLSRDDNPELAILYDSFTQTNIKDIEEVYDCLKSLDEVKKMHAYSILENLKLYKKGKMHKTTTIVGGGMLEQWHGKEPDKKIETKEEPETIPISNIMSAATTTIKIIRDVLNEKVVVDCTKDKIIKDTYAKILDILPDDTPILTTNYDNIIERYYDGIEPPIRQGFKREGHSHVWRNYWSGEGRMLVKIHGSLLWKRDGDKIKAYDTKAERNSNEDVMIYPDRSLKKYKNKPFNELFLQTKKILEKTNLLIVLGFSFRDKNINKILRYNLDDGMKMIVFSKDAVGDIKANFSANGLDVGSTVDNDIITHNLDFLRGDANNVMQSVIESVNALNLIRN